MHVLRIGPSLKGCLAADPCAIKRSGDRSRRCLPSPTSPANTPLLPLTAARRPRPAAPCASSSTELAHPSCQRYFEFTCLGCKSLSSLLLTKAPQKLSMGHPKEETEVPGNSGGGDGNIQASKFLIRSRALVSARRTVGFLAEGTST